MHICGKKPHAVLRATCYRPSIEQICSYNFKKFLTNPTRIVKKTDRINMKNFNLYSTKAAILTVSWEFVLTFFAYPLQKCILFAHSLYQTVDMSTVAKTYFQRPLFGTDENCLHAATTTMSTWGRHGPEGLFVKKFTKAPSNRVQSIGERINKKKFGFRRKEKLSQLSLEQDI